MNSLSRRTRREAARAVREIGNIPGLEAVILFGSVARGTAHPGSDCDIAVLGTRRACEEASVRLPYEHIGLPVGLYPMAREDGYAGYTKWGSMGREILLTGRTLMGDRKIAEKMVEPPPERMEPGDVVRRQRKSLRPVRGMLDTWAMYRSDPDQDWLEGAAAESGKAGEIVSKNGCHYAGFAYVKDHELKVTKERLRERGREGPAVIDEPEDEAIERVAQMLDEVNGHTKKDNVLPYPTGNLTEEEMGALEARVSKRMASVLKHALGEHERICSAPRMETVEKASRKEVVAMAEAAQRITKGEDPQLVEQAQAWMRAGREAQSRTRQEEEEAARQRAGQAPAQGPAQAL